MSEYDFVYEAEPVKNKVKREMKRLTNNVKEISRRYLKVERYYGGDNGNFRLKFNSGIQTFTVVIGTREECRWYKPMMAIALSNMVEELKHSDKE
mgnify:CR=1 FL=1